MSQTQQQDEHWMALAINLAWKGLFTTDPNPRVGCVLVQNNQNIGQGWHERAGEPHAEIHAIKDAKQQGHSTEKATAYVTLEPCSHQGLTGPCANALIAANVTRVVVAMQDPNPQVAGKGLKRLRDAGIEVQCGVLESKARSLNPGFIKRMETGMPFVRLKMACSLDGRTALANGESQWITGTEARQDVQQWRARSSAIVTGIGTILDDNPSLNVRLENTGQDNSEQESLGQNNTKNNKTERQPLRVIMDSSLRTPANAKIFTLSGETICFYINDPKEKAAIPEFNDKVQQLPDLEPLTVLQALAKRNINEVWVEAGATLAGSFIDAGCVDELIVYQAPMLLGDKARPLIKSSKLTSLADATRWQRQDMQPIGDDVRFIFQPSITSPS